MTQKRELNLEPTDAIINALGAAKRREFWSRVKKGPGCWEFRTRCNRGYGRIFANGRYHKAHRVSWVLRHGPIPKGNGVLHRCDNPPCVRPSHLFVGDQKTNWADMVTKGRGNTNGGEGHPNTRLTRRDVLLIRRTHIRGTRTSPGNTSELMKRFSVSRSTISRVSNMVSFKGVK